MSNRPRLLVLVLSASVLPSVALGATRTVCPSACDFPTLSAALGSSVNGDVLVLSNGLTYNESNLILNVNVTIRAATPGSGARPRVTAGSSSTFQVPTGRTLTLDYVEVANTATNSSEVWLSGGNLAATNVVFAAHGGGIYSGGVHMGQPGSLTLTDVTFQTMSTTGNGGAAIWGAGNLSLTRVTATAGGTAPTTATGGFLRMNNSGTVVLDDCAIANYSAGTGGVIGVSTYGIQVTVRDSDLSGTANNNGGAIGFTSGGSGTRLDLIDTVIHDSIASGNQGGGVYSNNNLAVTIVRGSFEGNRSGTSGGAVYLSNASPLVVDGTEFLANTARDGGALWVAGPLVDISDATFEDNTATNGAGGALRAYNKNSTVLALAACVFSGNSATGDGGAIDSQAEGVTALDNLFIGNTSQQRGGAVRFDNGSASAEFEVRRNTFTGNSATGRGGAVQLWTDGDLTLEANVFEANDAMSDGGGLNVDSVDALIATRNVFCDNTAASGGGLSLDLQNNNSSYVTNNFFVENVATGQGAAVYATDATTFANNLFIANAAGSNGGAVRFQNASPVFRNNLVGATTSGSGVSESSVPGSFSYNGYWANLASHLYVDFSGPYPVNAPSWVFGSPPVFRGYSPGTPGDDVGCSGADFRLQSSTPSVGNAGDPALLDLDGTRSDAGPFGGKYADPAWWVDADGDGSRWVYDCDDQDASVAPTAPEVCNGVDDDCNGLVDDGASVGLWFYDGDNDSYGLDTKSSASCVAPPGYVAAGKDCDDTNAAVSPGDAERCATLGVDDDCDGTRDEADAVDAKTWHADVDADTYGASGSTKAACTQPIGFVADATDCDDARKATNPAAPELCNSIDDDCDLLVDDNPTDAKVWYADVDADSFGNPTATSKACVQPAGFVAASTDCNDADKAISPAAPEVCNGVDDDCDAAKDDGLVFADWYVDADADGYGAGKATNTCATSVPGSSTKAGDCADTDKTVSPGAAEVCDHKDQDCDTLVDEGLPTKSYSIDADKDGQGSAIGAPVTDCAAPAGYVADARDCDDASSTVYTGAIETCNSKDDDCDGVVDDNVATYPFYQDKDGDGYGSSVSKVDCKAPAGYVQTSGDCDDGSSAVSPAATETCDGVDQDCDGTKDDNAADAPTWFADSDKDGFGSATSTTRVCGTSAPPGFVVNSADCDDKSSTITDGIQYYVDLDLDGYGDPATVAYVCVQPAGYVPNSKDCNDADKAVRPGGGEFCATIGRDDDCDGKIDDVDVGDLKDATVWYPDNDNDDYGVSTTTITACVAPPLYASATGDCDDASPSIRPDAPEQCDAIDNDCDGSVDEQVVLSPWWPDSDGDGFGNVVTAATPFIDCKAPVGYIDNYLDCKDTVAAVNPNATERCNGFDDNCDGLADDADLSVADPVVWYQDLDADGYGTQTDVVVSCESPPEHAALDGDCWDDLDAAAALVNPDALEGCNDLDDDCDGRVDENLPTGTVYVDGDGDGYGDAALPIEQCGPSGVGQADLAGDCDDADANASPDAAEIWYDGIDEDCDGGSDFDQDGDGADALETGGSDCDDEAAAVHPGATDTANGVDDDCDGVIDGAPPASDRDDDGLTDEDEIASGTNPDVADTDGDGVADGDEVGDPADPTDTDGDGEIDALDDDDDGDGLPSGYEGHEDTDGDGLPDDRDTDSDDDGIPDAEEGPGDSDGDGITDRLDPDGLDEEEDPGKCGCATGSAGGLPFALLGLLLARRRRY